MQNPIVAEKLKAVMSEHGLEAIVCLSPENIAYSAGFVVPSQVLMRWRHAALIMTARGDVSFFCVDMEAETVRAARPEWDVRTWTEFSDNAMHVLGKVLASLGLSGGRVGIELDYLAARHYEELQSVCGGVAFVPVDAALAVVRQTKTASEVDLLATLSRISETAIIDALGAVRAGDTEMDIAATLTRRVYEQGAHSFKLMIVATGERSQLPNVGPSTRVLQPGDVCRVEIFSVADGYQAGVCRTAVVGEPSTLAQDVYRRLAECKSHVLDALRPGAVAGDVYRKYRKHFDALNMPAIGFVGHSIGVNLHEPPYLGPGVTDRLQDGMVLGIEPLVYRSGHGFGMQIKDMVHVTATGCELLSDVSSTDELIRIEA
ncbi:M24 family metallopeptidase [Nocardioides caldifontis]|uniref:M24 family metallopeptidase n=1 Tax=Nocardioides caldifontis TaxID=2588938 RepID=UPI0011E06982|nr:Xaa-Pro peptidase family protein [Nocardioides caldifontis]